MNPTTAHVYSKQNDKHLQQKKECSTLMSLANELFDFILIYLSPCDVVKSLTSINKRLDLLIYPFIHRIDVSKKKPEWLKKHLLSMKPLITHIQFNHKQLRSLFSTESKIHDQYQCLKSMIWDYKCCVNDRLFISYLNVFKTKSLSLTLNLHSDGDDAIDNNIAIVLLQNDSLIEELIFTCKNRFSLSWFSFQPNILKLNQHLKRLTIKLHYIHDLFILIENLSKLEYLNVEVCEAEKKDKHDYINIRKQTATLSRVLKQLIVHSLDFTYPRLLLFLEQFQQSIELLKLDMSISDRIDGEIIESTIIAKMPQLKKFEFLFHMFVKENINIDTGLNKLISTFRSSYWLTRSVMCYHERSYPCFTVFSLPWTLEESESVTNEIINHRTNTTVPLQIQNIKSLFLASTIITLEFLKFIQKTFPNLKTMIISWFTCTLDLAVLEEKNKIELATIKTIKYYGTTDDLEFLDFLLLIPNLRCLTVDGITVHIINGYAPENESLISLCKQISNLCIFRNAGRCEDDETKETFPNAKISFNDI
ncbi:unnamed protein product [Rotaria magnacalcarata]|uniref:Uncharacterized protein n=2 Tax=Rotaria magnacalcarata TaxID=392030 RepID=A0A816XAV9_9BILA|nr:unnamed protein product [Rotaria magnacalcarata]CAF2144970.1 unnamed protein product [Rotaria magnacalcarata]CAF4200104.1 unnamed protein product [Rotaria magnacalcarata]